MLNTKDAIMWGQMHEDTAIDSYIKLTGNRVDKIGLCLFECGFLGSTPDGVVHMTNGENGVLEVKCPYKYRDCTIDEMIKLELNVKTTKKGFFLNADGNLNANHSYWHQVQAEIHSTKVTWADFVVWTLKDVKIVRVEKDEDWSSTNISKLTEFYLNVLIPTCYVDDNDM